MLILKKASIRLKQFSKNVSIRLSKKLLIVKMKRKQNWLLQLQNRLKHRNLLELNQRISVVLNLLKNTALLQVPMLIQQQTMSHLL